MTNAEKFKEIFGFDLKGTCMCTSEKCDPNCKKNPNSNITDCPLWLNEEYKKEEKKFVNKGIPLSKEKTGEWLRMSDLSEQEDDRYKCSCCGNVVHHKDKMNLYTFNSWCGRCGSNNGRQSEVI